MASITLKSLLKAHPEYADLPIVIYDDSDLGYWYVQEDEPYVDEQIDDELIIPSSKPVLVFSAN